MEKRQEQRKGYDSNGREYLSVREWWKDELRHGEDLWYGMANQYWSSQDCSISGVLSGFPEIHEPDIASSSQFLARVFADLPKNTVLDCGAGIGRVSKFVLSPVFQAIDLVEQCEKFVKSAEEAEIPNTQRFFVSGLQEFTPDEGYYDCIWCQWVLAQLTEEDMAVFLAKAIDSLTDTGVIIVKENIKKRGFKVDREDNSLLRSDFLYREAFERSNLQLIDEQKQEGFPEDFYLPHMYALIPKSRNVT